MQHCKLSEHMNKSNTGTDIYKPFMGRLTGSNHHDLVPYPTCNSLRARASHGAFYIFACLEHHSVFICRYNRFRIPILFHPKGSESPRGLSHFPNPRPSPPCEHLLVPRFALRICQSRTHRLPDIYPRQVLQAPSGYAASPDDLPQEIPFV